MYTWLSHYIYVALLLSCGCASMSGYVAPSVENEGDCDDSDDIDLVQTHTQMLLKGREASATGLKDTEANDKQAVIINLNDAPKVRFQDYARKMKSIWINTGLKINDIIHSHFSASTLDDWWEHNTIYPEYLEEIQGIVEVLDHPNLTVKNMALGHILYEMGNPTVHQGCTGILAQQSDGSVVHGRNLDYVLPTDSSEYLEEVTFYRDGKPLFVSVSLLSVGVHTAMRFGGWSIEQNTRLAKLDGAQSLLNMKKGGLMNAFVLRKTIEDAPDYATALQTLEKVKFAAPQYFVIAGTKADEGAVFTVDGFQPHPPPYTTTEALASSIGRWYLVQTNDDLWGKARDDRRPFLIAAMNSLNHEAAGDTAVEQILTTPPVYNFAATIFTWIANPGRGTHKLIVHKDVTEKQPIIQKIISAR